LSESTFEACFGDGKAMNVKSNQTEALRFGHKRNRAFLLSPKEVLEDLRVISALQGDFWREVFC
jgi:hypothetical protein